jgi:hypothetical protein
LAGAAKSGGSAKDMTDGSKKSATVAALASRKVNAGRVPLPLDGGQDRGVVVDDVGDGVRAGVGADDDDRHPGAVQGVATRLAGRPDGRGDVVGGHGGGRGHVVVVAAVLVVEPDLEGAWPGQSRRDGVDDRCDELLAELDVLGVLLGLARRLDPQVRLGGKGRHRPLRRRRTGRWR